MRAKKIFCLLLVLWAATSNAQSNFWCATDKVTMAEMDNNPAARARYHQLEEFAANYVANNPAVTNKSNGLPQYIIPVVFHVIHNYGPENISDAQIYDEMQNLNRNYNGLRTDTAAVYPTFKSIIADVEIEFRLAQFDPNGNCTNGITRTASMLTYNANNNSMINTWPQNQYLNIWTVSSFDPALGGPGAYTFLPGVAPPGKDGIIALHNYVGSIGTSSTVTQYAITHECAHWFGIPHIWGITNAPGVTCGDDGVADTPITKGFNPCPSLANAASCNPPIVENYQNYMDYSYCYYMFTNGQKAKMWATLNTPLRNQLYTQANLLATGIDGSIYNCVPIAFFDNRSTKYICEGGSIVFRDLSLNLDSVGNTFSWYSSGANPVTVTGAQALLTFPAAGVYDVELTVTNAAGSDTYLAAAHVVVTSGVMAASTPFTESFETIAIPGAADWFVDNESATSNAFVTTGNTAFTGNNCLKLQNYSGNTSGTKDVLITAPFNLTNTTATKAYFRVAYANRATTSSDVLKVFVSTDCGATWVQRYVKTASQLKTVSNIVANNFVPPTGSVDTSQWRQDVVNLASFSNQPNVRLKFEFMFDTGNNLYIDDINISGVVGLDKILVDETTVTIFPNPTLNLATLSYELMQVADVQVLVTDIAGRALELKSFEKATPGNYEVELNVLKEPGIYLVSLRTGNETIIKKLVVQ